MFLDRECAGDPELRRHLDRLLRDADGAGAPDETAPGETHPGTGSATDPTIARVLPTQFDPGPAEARGRAAQGAGTRLGPYRLLEKLGEGGMGTVFLADQEEPVRRSVALKIIRLGMDSALVVARFEAERQALAMMDHPNIAKVFDAGATEDGRPYFAMELVRGVPITDYCDDARLSPRERLELFIPVCEAIQHAHQKGVIHRDIKPSNVLVTMYDGRPAPKVIDFGIAKATDRGLAQRTTFTQYGTIVGTLEYMSPEQAESSEAGVDTRSDVYSLGVMLYELLTGTTPLKRAALRDAGLAEILKRIRDEEPPRPSTRLSDSKEMLAALSAHRRMEPAKLARLLRGDLDWIVMKALEKDRGRRYDSASGFARDVRRYLEGEAVEARPPTASYRLRKFAGKNKGAIATAAAMAALLLIGAVASTWQAIRATTAERLAAGRLRDVSAANARTEAALADARTERDAAVAERKRADGLTAVAKSEGEKAARSAAEARAVLGFFEDRVLAAARPEGQRGGLGKDVTLRAAVDAAEPTIAGAFRDNPTVEAYVRNSLGTTYRYLGELGPGAPAARAALELRRAALGPDHPETLASQAGVALGCMDIGRLDRAIPLFEETLAARKSKLGADDPDTLTTQANLALAYGDAGRLDRSLPLHERTLAARVARFGADHPDTLTSQNYLAVAYKTSGRLDLAIPLFERTLAARAAKLGVDHPDTLISQNNLAATYKNAGRLDRAIPLFERTLESRTARLGADHPNTLNSRNNLASAYRDDGQLARAIPLLEQTLAARAAKLGPEHADTLASQYSLAIAYREDDRTDQAIALLEKTLKARRSRLGPDHPDNLKTQSLLGLAYRDAGRLDLAIPLLERTLEVAAARLGADHPDTLTTRNNLALALIDAGEAPRAIPLLEQALASRSSRLGAEHPDTLSTQGGLALAYREAGAFDRAVPLFERTAESQAAKLGADHPQTLLTRDNLAAAYLVAGQADRGVALLAATLAARSSRQGADHPRTLATRHELATAYLAQGDAARSESILRQVLEVRKARLGAEHPDVAATLSALGASLLAQEKYAEAEPLLLAGYAGLKAGDARKGRVAEAGERIARLYESTGRTAEAKAWRERANAPGPTAADARR